MSFLLFPVAEKVLWFSSLIRIRSGIFCHCKIDEMLTKCLFAYIKNLTHFTYNKNLTILNLERGADLDRFRLVS